MSADETYAEIRVYAGVAERTGATASRAVIRTRTSVCRSVRELVRKARRYGDGYFYLLVAEWPEGVTEIELSTAWIPISS